MDLQIILGCFIPLIGTSLGAGAVYFIKNNNNKLQVILSLLASGVMLAASIWGLIIPSINLSEYMQTLSFVPAVIGIWLGIIFFVIIEKFISTKEKIMPLAVFIHNIPEGLAVGVALAGGVLDNSLLASAFALSIGISVQNIPEGAIISMPLYAAGKSKHRAFAYGFISGAIEPLFAVFTLFAVGLVVPLMPYLMSFAAGCMIYVCVSELIPQISKENGSLALFSFVIGFTLMLVLDAALG